MSFKILSELCAWNLQNVKININAQLLIRNYMHLKFFFLIRLPPPKIIIFETCHIKYGYLSLLFKNFGSSRCRSLIPSLDLAWYMDRDARMMGLTGCLLFQFRTIRLDYVMMCKLLEDLRCVT